jgi:hypothetical protein
MSKYTTEVRFICEEKSGLDISVNSSDVNNVIANSWNKIFTTNTPFFDEEYRSVLCQKILKHYYLREIGCETVGVWLLWMNTRLEEIMPYYNQLYESAKIKFNPMHDVELTREYIRKADGSSTEDETRKQTTKETKEDEGEKTRNLTGNINTADTSKGTINKTNTGNDTKYDLYSDTPQGAITGIENENYLTNARKITDNNTETDKEDTSTTGTAETTNTENETTNNKTTGSSSISLDDTTSNTGVTNTTENYVETITGKQGTESFSTLLNKFRDTLLNIDMQVINEFNDLFFGLW